MHRFIVSLLAIVMMANLGGADEAAISAALKKRILAPGAGQADAIAYCEARVPTIPKVHTPQEWNHLADNIRKAVLERAVYRGAAAGWRDAKCKVEYLESIAGGPGYSIQKLRFEAVPGLWAPALLYLPTKIEGKVPVALAVNGHAGLGKALPYKQIRCINLAKRGMIVLNLEWLGMGQLSGANYNHAKMNQLDLCGTSGLAPFYLLMKRGLDILLAHPNANPSRVSVSGLSGGGWQTIIISSLDERVTLADPVAGYSSFKTRARFHSDLGDSEQTPVDLATVADYTHLTALRAPKPTLLTFNKNDDCCFASDHALPPLLEAVRPIYALYGKTGNLTSHVNFVPGTHNFEKDNREAFYKVTGEHFFAGKPFDAKEIPSDNEVKSADQLKIDLPTNNADFNSLARGLMAKLPVVKPGSSFSAKKGTDAKVAESVRLTWQRDRRAELAAVVRQGKPYSLQAESPNAQTKGAMRIRDWKFRINNAWSVPGVEFTNGEPKRTLLVLADEGKASQAARISKLLTPGTRVLVVDPFYTGESSQDLGGRAYLFALFLSTIGDRPVGVQAGQLASIARWCAAELKSGPVTVVADGPRLSLAALVAAALEPQAIGELELHRSLASLKEVIEKNQAFAEAPEFFCFGLLEAFDINKIAELVSPRLITIAGATPRHYAELANLHGPEGAGKGKLELTK